MAPEAAKARRPGGLSPVALDADADEGRAYLGDQQWARQYAGENRLAMLRAVERLLDELFGVQLDWTTLIHSDHNHVQRKTHGGKQYWVHRKGAQAVAEGEPGIVPGSMGDATHHVVGRGNLAAMNSCSHGAGRRLSRSEARRPSRLGNFSGECQACGSTSVTQHGFATRRPPRIGIFVK